MDSTATKMTNDLMRQILLDFFAGKKVDLADEYIYDFGTHEWCNVTFNSSKSCEGGCLFCYAWIDAIFRGREGKDDYGIKMLEKDEWWQVWADREEKFIIMYPSIHDTNTKNMAQVFFNISLMMLAKNVYVLFVTKPNYTVMKLFAKLLYQYRDRIFFRLTMTTNDEEQLKFWEPNAPSFNDRLKSIKLLCKRGFQTSVSCEPMMPPMMVGNYVESMIAYVDSILPYVQHEFWLGMMNHVPVERYHNAPLTEEMRQKFASVTQYYTEANIVALVRHYHQHPKIQWKESVKRYMIEYIRRTQT